jgi:hypothetical protein
MAPLREKRLDLPTLAVGWLAQKNTDLGKPEIGAQFRLWIFSYAIFKILPRVMLSQPTISGVPVRRSPGA